MKKTGSALRTPRSGRWWLRDLVLVVAVLLPAAFVVILGMSNAVEAQAVAQGPDFVNYESGPVRPIAMTPSGSMVLVANTPAAQLDVLHVLADGSLRHAYSVPVGLEPVAVAARSDSEVWVVNHLSDSVSVVDLNKRTVVRTLLVGDEPRDVVFAGPNSERAFVTTAHRGQRRMDPALASVPGAGDPQLTTPGVGRADAWVFHPDSLGVDPGGIPLAVMSFFADTPRALAVSSDKLTVYVASHFSGNQTTVLAEPLVCNGFREDSPCNGDGISVPGGLANGQLPGGVLGPTENHQGTPAVETGVIVKYDNLARTWIDEAGRNWGNGVRFTLPDLDVFAVDALGLNQRASFAHVGTTLFNMATNPATGRVYVTNTDSQNHIRFEGHSESGHSSVQGHIAESRITVLDPVTGAVTPRHLNSHIDYSIRPAPPGTRDHSLATPLDLVFSPDGSTVYVAAYGSDKIGVIDTATLEAGALNPAAASVNYISVSGGGPAGLAMHSAASRMYAFTRFDVGISIIDLASNREVDHLQLFNPEPAVVRNGRPVMYDANFASSNGESSCASCHVFSDLDSLSWNLGNPDADTLTNPLDFELANTRGGINGTGQARTLNALKGPMATQTLRGLVNQGAQHWRADRSVGFFGTDPTDARHSFRNFIVAFPELLGSEREPTDPDLQEAMNRLTEFTMTLMLPPNPVRNLDQSLTPQQAQGNDLFFGNSRIDSGVRTCTQCHQMDATQGRFGTNLKMSFEGEIQHLKIPHIRNMYTKVGMFGMAANSEIRSGNNDFMGPQIRGFGFNHNGSMDTLSRFFGLDVFNTNQPERDAIEAAMLIADTDLAPIVGQQITSDSTAPAGAQARVALLMARAATPFVSKELGGATTECSLIATYHDGTRSVGHVYDAIAGRFIPDRAGDPDTSLTLLLAGASNSGAPVTFTCVSPGAAIRLGIDRNLDGVLNGDDIPPVRLGDVNCDDEMDVVDALFVAQFSVGNRVSVAACPLLDARTEIHAATGDVNGDARADVVDALFIAQCSAGNRNVACLENPP